jgi:hypothetical protein
MMVWWFGLWLLAAAAVASAAAGEELRLNIYNWSEYLQLVGLHRAGYDPEIRG